MLRKRDENGEVRPSWEETTEEYSFDELARGLASGTISRRKALKWMGAGLVSAAVATAGFPNTAQALTRRQRRRCRDKEGIPLEEGNCHCAFQCGAERSRFDCQNSTCKCYKTVGGRGFCSRDNTNEDVCDNDTCDSSSDCPGDQRCVVQACCQDPNQGYCVRPC